MTREALDAVAWDGIPDGALRAARAIEAARRVRAEDGLGQVVNLYA